MKQGSAVIPSQQVCQLLLKGIKMEQITNLNKYSSEEIEKILSRLTPRPILHSPASKLCTACYRYEGKIYNIEGLLYYILGRRLD